MQLDQRERSRVVASDLTFLATLWDQDVSEDSLRRVSPMLRSLLVNGELQRVWKEAGFPREPVVSGSSLKHFVSAPVLRIVSYAAAGGARFRGNEVRAGAVFKAALSAADIASHHAAGLPSETAGLSTYLNAPGMIVDGEPIARRTIIKFIANVLGGVHFGSKMDKKPEEMRRYRLLDRARKEFFVLEHPCVYFELLSIGQAVVASEDVRRLQAEISGSAGRA